MNVRLRFVSALFGLAVSFSAAPFATAQAPAVPSAPVIQTKPAPSATAKPVEPPEAPDVTITPVSRDGKWMIRHELINSRAVPGEVDVIFFGDSITQGWEGDGKEVWAKYYGSRKAMNAGISGDRTQHVLWRIENGNIKGITPKLAVLMIGTNNSGRNTSEQIADGIKAIVAKLREKLPQTKVLVLAVFPRGPDAASKLRIVNEKANAIVKSLDDGKSIFYLDIGPQFLSADGTLDKKIMYDLLHLTPEGYEIWAKSIEPKVVELLGEKK
ncbi:MAG: GDSL family lipase [Planctomycetia bacterium]|nr:GDSL family lipase [Planctomycetia bacterium]